MGLQPEGSRGEIYRLLVVDDIPDTAANVQKLLHFERKYRVVGTAVSGREALQKAEHLHPDIILMDINLRDLDGIQVAEAIMRQWPTCIVMMSVESDPDLFSQAMAIGARGYLVKPFTSERLVRTLDLAIDNFHIPVTVAGPAVRGTLRKVVAVYSPKGGAGTSVLAANLAIAIQQATQKSVVLMDANLQNGDAHVLLNINTSSSIDDLREAGALDQEIINSTVVRHGDSEIGLLRAPLAPESAELFTQDTMRAIIVELRDHFDYVVVDTGSTFSEATLTVLEEADIILCITTLEVTAIHRVSQFFQIADRVEGIEHTKIRLICNRVEQYYGIRPNQVESQLRRRFLAQIPEDERLVVASTNRGVPFIVSQRGAPISRSISELAKRVHEVVTAPGGEQPKRGGWSFLGN